MTLENSLWSTSAQTSRDKLQHEHRAVSHLQIPDPCPNNPRPPELLKTFIDLECVFVERLRYNIMLKSKKKAC